jgi:hypothetical protein
VFPRVWDYDISSAYPSVAISLPALTNGEWQQIALYDPSLEFALWDCEWNLPDAFLTPFPVRLKGQIHYPRNGRGWYHASEVRAAQKLTVNRVNVHSGWQFKPATHDKPFAFIPQTYADRADLKREKHAGEKVLKLGLNSIYGKLAQGAGYQDKPPLFQSFFWAGMITAGTRARVLEIASAAPNDLVMIATDGIFFKSDPGIETADGLGGLELSVMEDMFVAQAGVYQATIDGDTIGKARGFFSREIDFDNLRRGYAEHGIAYCGEYASERFVGLGSAMIMGDMDKWRTWPKSTRKMTLHPARKFINDYALGDVVELHPPMFTDPAPSEIYTPKPGFATLTDSELEGLLEYIQGTEQPMRNE